MKKLTITLLSLVALLFAANVQAAQRPLVFVSITPQQYFVEKIAGDRADISVMVRPGASPATYEPSPKQLAALANAAAYFSIGVPFESAWLPRIKDGNKAMHVYATDKGITKLPMASHEHHDDEKHEHEEHGHDKHHEEHEEHGHDGKILDPHIWLSPLLARIIAHNIADGLTEMDPESAAFYAANLAKLNKKIDALQKDIAKTLKNVPEERRTFLVFHPSWGYFAHDFGLTQVPIEAEGKEPGPKALMNIIREGKELGVKVVFVQPQFSGKSAKVIASALDAKVIPLDPLAADWDSNLRRAANIFKEALR